MRSSALSSNDSHTVTSPVEIKTCFNRRTKEETIYSQADLNRDSLEFLKSEGLLLGTSLARNVENKIRQDSDLSEVEQGILYHGITNEKLRFVKQHLVNDQALDD